MIPEEHRAILAGLRGFTRRRYGVLRERYGSDRYFDFLFDLGNVGILIL